MGILRATGGGPPPCGGETTDLPLTGTLEPDGHLTMTMPISSGVTTFSLLVPQTRSSLSADSSVEVIGGGCARAQSTVRATEFANISGTYAGTLRNIAFPPQTLLETATVTAVLVQSPTPSADGQFTLSGTVTATGDCSGTYTFSDGVVTGEYLQSSGRLGSLMVPSVMMFSGLNLNNPNSLSAGIANFPGCRTILHGSLARQ